MSELVHDAAGIDAEGDKGRREGVAQLVWRQTLWQRNLPRFGQLFIGR